MSSFKTAKSCACGADCIFEIHKKGKKENNAKLNEEANQIWQLGAARFETSFAACRIQELSSSAETPRFPLFSLARPIKSRPSSSKEMISRNLGKKALMVISPAGDPSASFQAAGGDGGTEATVLIASWKSSSSLLLDAVSSWLSRRYEGEQLEDANDGSRGRDK